jgi:hypothetical protein
VADNTEEEHLDNPKNLQSENPSDEIIPTTHIETFNLNQETENMEVHHHPDLHHKPKKWKEYFLESLMIFLAVTVGFFAENLRENYSNRENEKIYMESLVQDIKDDISTINHQQKTFDERVVLLDSLIAILDASSITSNTGNLYYYARLATKSDVFSGNTRTFEQIKNTGGFRFIKNNDVAESIMSYYAIVQQIKQLQFSGGEEGEMNEYRKIAVQIFNADVFNQINSSSLNLVTRPADNPPLRTTDKKLLGDLAGWVHYIKNTKIGIYQFKKDLLEKGEKLIQQIQNEYHID